MKNLYQKLKNLGKGLLVIGGLTALLSGCTAPTYNKKYLKSLVTIKGEPVSCAVASLSHNPAIAIVIKSEEKYITAMKKGHYNIHKYVTAAAAVKSEINDKDNEPITITGKHRDYSKHGGLKYLEIGTIEANGIKVDLGRLY